MTAIPAGTTTPWAPQALSAAAGIDALRAFRYVVLEEIVDQTALLRSWPWPVIDQHGRLVWPGEAEHDMHALTIDLDTLRGQLYTHNGLHRRPRVGDVFAVEDRDERIPGTWRNRHTADLREAVAGAVYDVSADAREAAKIAYTASLAAIAPPGGEEEQEQAEVSASIQARAEAPLPMLEIAPPPQASS